MGIPEDSVFKAGGNPSWFENDREIEKYRTQVQTELQHRLVGRKIEEVFLKRVQHSHYTFQTFLRLNDNTIVEIPFLSGDFDPACIEHVRERKVFAFRAKFAKTAQERKFFRKALKIKK